MANKIQQIQKRDSPRVELLKSLLVGIETADGSGEGSDADGSDAGSDGLSQGSGANESLGGAAGHSEKGEGGHCF